VSASVMIGRPRKNSPASGPRQGWATGFINLHPAPPPKTPPRRTAQMTLTLIHGAMRDTSTASHQKIIYRFLTGFAFCRFCEQQFLFVACVENADHTEQKTFLFRDVKKPKKKVNLSGRCSMCKNILTVAAAIVIVSTGSLVSAQAGGGATSAPSKYNGTPHTVKFNQAHNNLPVQSADYRITEFSSSSAKTTAPKR
jgi:hypothetical protein